MARCGCFFTCIMYLNTILLSIFLIVFCRVSYAHWESKEAIAKADWVDPHEMFPLKSKSSSEIALSDRLSKRQGPCTEKDCSYLLAPSVARAEVIMLRHVLRRFVSFTDLSVCITSFPAYPCFKRGWFLCQVKKDATFDVSMRIDPDQFRAFEQLLETPLEDAQSTPVLDAWNQLTKTLRVSVEPTSVESVEKFIGFKLNLVFQVRFSRRPIIEGSPNRLGRFRVGLFMNWCSFFLVSFTFHFTAYSWFEKSRNQPLCTESSDGGNVKVWNTDFSDKDDAVRASFCAAIKLDPLPVGLSVSVYIGSKFTTSSYLLGGSFYLTGPGYERIQSWTIMCEFEKFTATKAVSLRLFWPKDGFWTVATLYVF